MADRTWNDTNPAASRLLIVIASSALALILILTFGAFSGCGGPQEFPVRGTVTYKGQPVPVGSVRFEPADAAEQIAPAGFAVIKDGVFCTEKGKGCMRGSYIAHVSGYDGKPTPEQQAMVDEVIQNESQPLIATGMLLFAKHTIKVEIKGPHEELKIEVPANSGRSPQ